MATYPTSVLHLRKDSTTVMEMLTHINRRVKDQSAILLPVLDLWKLYQNVDATPTVKNFSIVYIEMAFDRLPMEEKVSLAPEMLHGLSKLPVQHQDMLLRMVAKETHYYFKLVSYKMLCNADKHFIAQDDDIMK
eukprot:Gb_39351 [translate_table: standard]